MLPILKLPFQYKRPARRLLMLAVMAGCSAPAFAADAPAPSIFSNPLALTLLGLMGLLLIVIAILASILVSAADWKNRLRKKENSGSYKITMLLVMLLSASSLFAQNNPPAEVAVATIAGLSATAFYVMASVIFLELAIILALLINIRFLVRAARDKEVQATEAETIRAPRSAQPFFTWWNRINRFKPVEQEKDIDLGHEYDGIRELDNRLPPWWLWGFYVTIIFSVIYLWRYHVSESAPLSEEEYVLSMERAELRIQEYLKKKGESVNENTVIFLGEADDLAKGAKIYSASCVACHNAKGEGGVGPNLTDDYWLHGGDIKSIFRTIKYGVDGKGMAAWQAVYSPREIAQVASYIKAMAGTNVPNGREPQGVLYKEEAAPVVSN